MALTKSNKNWLPAPVKFTNYAVQKLKYKTKFHFLQG